MKMEKTAVHVALVANLPEPEQLDWLHALRAALPEAAWHLTPSPEEAHRIEIAVVANPKPGALAGLPRLRWIQSLWAGVEGLLADPTVPSTLPIVRMVDPSLAAAMVETALWAVLSLQRDFFAYAQLQRDGMWRKFPQRRADEISVAVLGLGHMGRGVAERLAAQGYIVSGWSRMARADVPPSVRAVTGDDALHALLSRSDIVIDLLPLTPATRGLLDARFFAAMRPGAAFVNLARGGHVVDDDLLAALDSGQVGHAVLDVFNEEPLPPAHRYWSHPRATLLPHVAARTDPTTASRIVADNIRAWRDGRPLAHLVDRTRGY